MPDLGQRNATIVDRVKAGEFMAAVGADYEITRERVRQICVKAGVTGKHAMAARDRYSLTCQVCGAERPKLGLQKHYRRIRVCSTACAVKARLSRWIEKKRESVLKVIALRREGASWKLCGETMGRHGEALHKEVRRWAELTGTDVTGVFKRAVVRVGGEA